MIFSKDTKAGRPPGFLYQPAETKGSRKPAPVSLHCEGVALTKLAQKFGTPLYVYSAQTIHERYEQFDQAFGDLSHTVCYSVKANSNLSLLRLLGKKKAGFDIVSGGELQRVLAADRRSAKRVVFSGVGKSREEISDALKAGILLFNVESESELATVAHCATHLKKAAPFALRVNPDVAAETHPYISTGLHKHKFGVPIASARSLYARAAKERYLRVCGVSVHIGSQITDAAPFGEAMSRVAELVRQLRGDGHQIDFVDAGGGLGISYQDARADFGKQVKEYARILTAPLRGLGIRLLLEPGRSIIGPSGVLLTKVIYRKSNDGKRFLIVDAAMNDLIRPALYGAHHEILPVVRQEAAKETTDIVGPVCETGDFFARDRELPAVQEGELLAIMDAGAYGMAISSNYNTRPRPAEVLVTGKTVRVIRRREKISELLRGER